MKNVMHLFVNGIAVFLTGYILPGSHIDTFVTALLVAFLLAVVNIIVKPIVLILTLPITILTLGLFAFVINALMILLVDYFVPGFRVDGILWAMAFSLVMSTIGSILHMITKG